MRVKALSLSVCLCTCVCVSLCLWESWLPHLDYVDYSLCAITQQSCSGFFWGGFIVVMCQRPYFWTVCSERCSSNSFALNANIQYYILNILFDFVYMCIYLYMCCTLFFYFFSKDVSHHFGYLFKFSNFFWTFFEFLLFVAVQLADVGEACPARTSRAAGTAACRGRSRHGSNWTFPPSSWRQTTRPRR